MTNAVSVAQSVASGVSLGFKNRIINGAMMIDQRNAGASVTSASGNTYITDRFAIKSSQASKFTGQQNAGAVTPPSNFKNYLGITSSSTYSVLSSDYFILYQGIEGLNSADLGWGTANASPVTLSFWVRSSLTGTFGGALRNDAGNRSYPYTYTISSANTWEYKTISIPGDTTGSWLTNNTTGIEVGFGLGVGSTYSGTAGSWAASNYLSATGATSVVGTNGATFYITGVQLEVGTTATNFDYRPYGTEFALCQRYYYKRNTTAQTLMLRTDGIRWLTVYMPVEMRATPTLSYTYNADGSGTTGTEANVCSTSFDLRSATSAGTGASNPYFTNVTASAEL
jgi:hypothetical protein